MRLKLLALILSAPVAFAAAADAGDALFTAEKVSGEIGLGTLSGKTKERVYDVDAGGRKVSQLNWKYNNAAIVKGSLDWDLIPWLSVGASGWTTIASRGGYMDDTDWLDENQKEWTDQSRHPNTRLNYANEFDINVKGWLLNEPAYRLGVMAGYQESRYSFKSTGGTYNYTDEETGLPDIGSFPADIKGIGYKQRFKMPYVGLAGSYRYENLEFGGAFKYSGWVRTSDNDEHYLTNTTFRAKIKNQNYYSLAGNAGYYVTPNAKVYVEGIWSRTTNKKGSLSANDRDQGTTNSAENSSGIESYNFMTTVGLKYAF
ncbi:omptin family outer membrane protease [Brenneria tiliae]|uniref:omptin family outer membrane protease n=1 Tax=Brenneria tiliae TaxID=2914984 RepID=UPI002014F70E|nr:omptin family outer membrane protease [Brenneria tiliae]MCL2900339.1 omptin family outer membrane protease [Brenneria tiliae]MCL2904174.1 omptin family outer membrane protease [Brenneria tiliae]